ncbi:hypothetical protein [Kribbella solani]|uniref:hypothetical protein n=1 Tax=Kribbella solani TaxID=236067 RepID=UPI0029B84CFE|nr:hypothetical protein [Kribbella solani]MDX2973403.1 hypothetical protein [Kribbella solani]
MSMRGEATPPAPCSPIHHVLLSDALELKDVQVVVGRWIVVLIQLLNHGSLRPLNLVAERWVHPASSRISRKERTPSSPDKHFMIGIHRREHR